MSQYVVQGPGDDEVNSLPVSSLRIATPPAESTGEQAMTPSTMEDFANLDEIERELELQNQFDDEDDIPDECYEFLEKSNQFHDNSYTQSFLPSGAVPSAKIGKLDPFAAEFWFPGSRECACCKGYKHGCPCVKDEKFYACQKEGCCEAAHKDMKLETSSAPAVQPRHAAPAHSAKPVHASVPSQNGQLSAVAAEFWFPDSRECSCCKGYKHGCDCCKKNGFYACQTEGCCKPEDKGKMNASSPGKSPGSSGNYSPNSRPQQHGGSNSTSFCRYEMSPSGCNMGDRCRFQHVYSYADTQQQQQYYGDYQPQGGGYSQQGQGGYQQGGYQQGGYNQNQNYYGGNSYR